MRQNLVPTTEPQTKEELLQRAVALAGRSLSVIAYAASLADGKEYKGHKGTAGLLVERALGIQRSNHAGPDAVLAGVEIKTLPISGTHRVAESTWVSMAHPPSVARETWETSLVFSKLRLVLFVPLRKEVTGELCMGTSFLWSPNAEEHHVLRSDWEDLADLLTHGIEISARRGKALQLRPKAAHNQERVNVVSVDGDEYRHAPRGFYLRRTFTQAIVQRMFFSR